MKMADKMSREYRDEMARLRKSRRRQSEEEEKEESKKRHRKRRRKRKKSSELSKFLRPKLNVSYSEYVYSGDDDNKVHKSLRSCENLDEAKKRGEIEIELALAYESVNLGEDKLEPPITTTCSASTTTITTSSSSTSIIGASSRPGYSLKDVRAVLQLLQVG